MINWKNVASLDVSKFLRFKQGAKIKVQQATGLDTEIDLDELAALNNLSAAELAVLDSASASNNTTGKAAILGTNGALTIAGDLTLNTVTISSGEIGVLDSASSANSGTGKAMITGTSGAVTVAGAATFQTAHSGLLFGAGATGAYHALGATADNATEFYLNGTHTTGDMRGMYMRLRFSGAGGSGEAVRAYGEVNNVTAATGGTVNGAHLTLGVTGASGAISGAGHAVRATLDLGAATNCGGTIDVVQCDTNIAADATIPARTSFLRFTNVGTGKLDYLMNIDAPSTTMVQAAGSGATSAGYASGGVAAKVVKLAIDGTDYYMPVFDTNA